MKRRGILLSGVLSAVLVAGIAATFTTGVAGASTDTGVVGTVTRVRTVSFPSSGNFVSGGLLYPEGIRSDGPAKILTGPATTRLHSRQWVDRSASAHPTAGQKAATDSTVTSLPLTTSAGTLNTSFNGLRHFDQRTANGGNQFSIEPPDQGLCIGNGDVVEVINSVMRVYSTSGTALSGVADLNTFYGYPAQLDRSTGLQGQFITDPNCVFDAGTGRWFVTVATLEVDPTTGDFTGVTHLDIAVSHSSDPTGSWTIYRIAAQDDGTQGTPDHNCPGPTPGSTGPCLPDFPQLAADANTVVITTNEYGLFAPLTGNFGFTSAQVYAIDKAKLVALAAGPKFVHFTTLNAFGTTPGFTLWPAKAVGTSYASTQGGTLYLLNTMGTPEANNSTGKDNRLGVWALTNTSTIGFGTPRLHLKKTLLTVFQYSVPPLGQQKSGGPSPLGECINDTQMTSPFWNGKGCWKLFFTPQNQPAHNEQLPPMLESNDSRITGTFYAAGDIWGVASTGLSIGGQNRVGVAYYVVQPSFSSTGVLSATIARQAKFGFSGNDLLFPSIAATSAGSAVIPFSITGSSEFPSAGYTTLTVAGGLGGINMIQAGLGPDDGFTGYKAFVGDISFGSRWGDYGQAFTVGSSIWVGSEYIGQTCTLSQSDSNYLTVDPTTGLIGTCGETRTALANWFTRISKITP